MMSLSTVVFFVKPKSIQMVEVTSLKVSTIPKLVTPCRVRGTCSEGLRRSCSTPMSSFRTKTGQSTWHVGTRTRICFQLENNTSSIMPLFWPININTYILTSWLKYSSFRSIPFHYVLIRIIYDDYDVDMTYTYFTVAISAARTFASPATLL